MRPRVAFSAQGAEVLVPVVAAFSERQHVVDLLDFPVDSFGKALLAKRVRVDVSVSDALPSPAVPALGLGVASVSFVSSVFFLLVLRAEPSLGEVGASGVGARPFRFPWHVVAPNEKPPGNQSLGGFIAVFYAITISGINGKCVRDIGHQGLLKSSTDSFWTARFFFLYADVRSMLKCSQMS